MTTPTLEQALLFFDHTVRHCLHVEYYMHALGVGHHDPQRPHDITGSGNKFEEDIFYAMASGYANAPDLCERSLQAAIARHRRLQHHHRAWADCRSDDDGLLIGAIDTICALREPRPYQGGPLQDSAVLTVTHQTCAPHQQRWIRTALEAMHTVERPLFDELSIERLVLPSGIRDAIHHHTCAMRRDIDKRYDGQRTLRAASGA